ncbi:MAG: glycoside hydrolase family 31 protein [Opitutaceae bacterium]|nr:glycoside hydrolase family 31 protein [Opitutaceae bacterium]
MVSRLFLHAARLLAAGTLAFPTTLPAAMRLEHDADAVRLFSDGGARLEISRSAWRLQLRDAQGMVKYADARPPAFRAGDTWAGFGSVARVEPLAAENGVGLMVTLSDGGSAAVKIVPFGDHGFTIHATCNGVRPAAVRGAIALDPVEEIYGFGETWNGHVAQRGQAVEIWDKGGTPDECAYMPYFVSTRNYAFFLNYGGRVRFDVGRRRADEITYEFPTDRLEFTLVSGDSIAWTVHHVLAGVGLPARPPRWAFEPWAWLMGDPDQPGASIDTLKDHHFIAMVQHFRELDIPVGVTWFEPPWQTARTTFVPDPTFCADVPGLIARLRELGVRTLAWTVPYTTPTAANWQEAVSKGYLVRKPGSKSRSEYAISSSGELVGNAYAYIDFFNPEAVAWWQAQIAPSVDLGLSGFKLDDGQGLQPDALLHGGRVGSDVRNSYAYEYNRVFGEVLRRKLGDDYLTIPRAAWLGSSAWANFKWPGDLSASYANNGLPSSLYSSLSLAFCGVPFVSTDIGGFMSRPPPEDVWVRWTQFGAFLPGMQTLHMPWWYSEKAREHYRYFSWLHQDLLPLWNSLAHEAGATGAPVVRPLVWTFQDDVDCWRVDDEFTVGDALLVAPIINPERERMVYFPPGRWIDFWDEREVIEGPQTVRWAKGWEESRWKFPLYVREGAIVPMEVSNSVTGFGSPESAGRVTLVVWPGTAGTGRFVLHDREGPVAIAATPTGAGDLAVSIDPSNQEYLLCLRRQARPPAAVRDGTSELPGFESLAAFRAAPGPGWCHDATAQVIWIRPARPNTPTETRLVVRSSGVTGQR